MADPKLILVTGATGYVGGRLVPRLLAAGYRVRCLVRDPARLQGRVWLKQVELARGDMLQPELLVPAMRDVQVVYYLVHSLGGGSDFSERDMMAARNCAGAARAAGVERIVYLGGLGDPQANLSPHLRSRQETGAALREAGVPVTEFRAAVIVGSGSLSFEMCRYLTERLPVMICPRWVFTRIQPIAIRNVLDYLVAALACPESTGRVLEIGGRDVLTYAGMMTGYARARGLKRRLLAVPVLTPRLSSYWVHLVTPIPASIARRRFAGQHAASERRYELLERQAVLLPFAFLRHEDALVDRAIEAWVHARGEFVAPTVAAHTDNKAVASCQIMVCRQRARGGKTAVVLERHFPLEQRHPVGQAKAAGGHAAHHVVVDHLPSGSVRGGLKVVNDSVSSSVRIHGKEQCEGSWNQKSVREALDKFFHDQPAREGEHLQLQRA
jgi:uncharacterized protein YbjT (DUF2867 family)